MYMIFPPLPFIIVISLASQPCHHNISTPSCNYLLNQPNSNSWELEDHTQFEQQHPLL